MEFGVTGPTFAVSSACASANHALAQALALVRSGQADAALAGGSEACLSYATFKAWEAFCSTKKIVVCRALILRIV